MLCKVCKNDEFVLTPSMLLLIMFIVSSLESGLLEADLGNRVALSVGLVSEKGSDLPYHFRLVVSDLTGYRVMWLFRYLAQGLVQELEHPWNLGCICLNSHQG